MSRRRPFGLGYPELAVTLIVSLFVVFAVFMFAMAVVVTIHRLPHDPPGRAWTAALVSGVFAWAAASLANWWLDRKLARLHSKRNDTR